MCRSDLKPIEPGTGFEDGVNFYDEFDEIVVNHGLRTMHTALIQEGLPCYCLRLDVDEDEHGYFCRFGEVFTPEGVSKPDLSLCGMIPLDLLVINSWKWPPLAIRVGPPPIAEYGNPFEPGVLGFLSQVSWHAQVRLQRYDEFIGYYICVGLNGSSVPSDRELIAAAYKSKIEVATLLSYRCVERARTCSEHKDHLRTARWAIEKLNGKSRTQAFQHVADVLTSHLGAGWNRAACYCPIDGDNLECLWAQGGDGEDRWCGEVQRPIGEGVRQPDGLVYLVQSRAVPGIDPYYAAAVLHQSIRIERVTDPANDNILARLWRENGDVRKLPAHNRAWQPAPRPRLEGECIDREQYSSGSDVAAVFNEQDPWVEQVTQKYPGEPVFASQNGKYWAFPWWDRRELVGIWVLDMAYWAQAGDQPCFPSLTFTQEILSALANSMRQYWPKH